MVNTLKISWKITGKLEVKSMDCNRKYDGVQKEGVDKPILDVKIMG